MLDFYSRIIASIPVPFLIFRVVVVLLQQMVMVLSNPVTWAM